MSDPHGIRDLSGQIGSTRIPEGAIRATPTPPPRRPRAGDPALAARVYLGPKVRQTMEHAGVSEAWVRQVIAAAETAHDGTTFTGGVPVRHFRRAGARVIVAVSDLNHPAVIRLEVPRAIVAVNRGWTRSS